MHRVVGRSVKVTVKKFMYYKQKFKIERTFKAINRAVRKSR